MALNGDSLVYLLKAFLEWNSLHSNSGQVFNIEVPGGLSRAIRHAEWLSTVKPEAFNGNIWPVVHQTEHICDNRPSVSTIENILKAMDHVF
jgi:hypothetical protein